MIKFNDWVKLHENEVTGWRIHISSGNNGRPESVMILQGDTVEKRFQELGSKISEWGSQYLIINKQYAQDAAIKVLQHPGEWRITRNGKVVLE